MTHPLQKIVVALDELGREFNEMDDFDALDKLDEFVFWLVERAGAPEELIDSYIMGRAEQ